MRLTEAFDAVVLITLQHRRDRRDRALRHLLDAGLIAREAELMEVEAICGDELLPPGWWKAGKGAWGCLLSHARVLQEGWARGWRQWLVLEDDVCFHPRAAAHLEAILSELPRDWGQLYLGGQHLKTPRVASRLLFRVSNVNRTHAYAVNARVVPKIHQHIFHAPDYLEKDRGWHLDHQLGAAHEREDWPAYAPQWWLAGQEAGPSNISGRTNGRQWWQPPQFAEALPFFWGEPVTDAQAAGLHYGNNLLTGTCTDIGLNDALGSPKRLRAWMQLIAREAISLGRLPALWHDCLDLAEARRHWSAGIHDVRRFDPGLLDYPFNGLFPHPFVGLNE